MKGLLRMTVDEAKKELREYRISLEKLAYLHELHVKKYLNLGMMRFKAENGSRSDSLLQRMEKAEKREAELETAEKYAVRHAESVRRTIDRKISKLSELDRKILTEKYYKNRSLIAVSMECCYEYTWLCKLHKKALEKYAELE